MVFIKRWASTVTVRTPTPPPPSCFLSFLNTVTPTPQASRLCQGRPQPFAHTHKRQCSSDNRSKTRMTLDPQPHTYHPGPFPSPQRSAVYILDDFSLSIHVKCDPPLCQKSAPAFVRAVISCNSAARCTKRTGHVLSYPVLSCPVRSGPVLSCPVLSCPLLFCPVLSCPVLSCPVRSSPVQGITHGRSTAKERFVAWL